MEVFEIVVVEEVEVVIFELSMFGGMFDLICCIW